MVESLHGDHFHKWFQVRLDDPVPEPGDYGVFRACCGSIINGKIVEESLRSMCRRCEAIQ